MKRTIPMMLQLRTSSSISQNVVGLEKLLTSSPPEDDNSAVAAPIDVALVVNKATQNDILAQLQALYDASTRLHFFNSVNILPRIESESGELEEMGLDCMTPDHGFDVHRYVAMGGTFDRLHSGHKMLLSASLLHVGHRLRVGVTGPVLLAKKKHAEVLQPFETRRDLVTEFIHKFRPGLELEVPELLEASGGTNTIPDVDAMVVSPETEPSFLKINEERVANGLKPMQRVKIEYVGGDEKSRISSTALREKVVSSPQLPPKQ